MRGRRRRARLWNYIIARDGHHCAAPGCSMRSDLVVVPIEPDRAGKARDLITVCRKHREIIERGYLRVHGRAPCEVFWDIACAPGRPPLMRTHGQLIIEQNGIPVDSGAGAGTARNRRPDDPPRNG